MQNYDHVDALISGGRKPSTLWKPTNEEYRDIRLLPSEPASETVFRHWNVLAKQQVKCLGRGCPICAVSKALKETAKLYPDKSEPRKVIEKAGGQIKCECRVGFNVLVTLPDGTQAVRVWGTTGANQRKIADLIALERQEDPTFDPCQYLLNVGYFSKRRPQEQYQLKFKVRTGATEVPEFEGHDLLATLEGNTVEMETEQALSVMQETYGGLLNKLSLGTVEDLIGAGAAESNSDLVSVGQLEALVDRAPVPTTSDPVATPETPAPDGKSNAQTMLDKLDG